MSSTHLKTCPACGTSVNITARFCKNCALDFSVIQLSNTQTTADPELDASTPKSSRHLIIAGGMLMVLVISIFSLWLYKKNSAVANSPALVPVTPASSAVSNRAIQVEDKVIRNETLTDSDVSGLSPQELRILRNVHFARYGRKYEKPGMGDYFYTRPWYQPREDFKENMLTDLDRSNIKVIQAAEDRIVAAQSRNWDTFWPMLQEAVERKDRGTLMKLMPSDFEWNCCALGDVNNNGDNRDDAFQSWSAPESDGWEELKKALGSGAVNLTAWSDSAHNRQRKIAPSGANRNRFDGRFAILELREEGRWYFVSFLVPERDIE